MPVALGFALAFAMIAVPGALGAPATNADVTVLVRTAGESAIATFPTPTDSTAGATVVCSPISGSAFAFGETIVSCSGTAMGPPMCVDLPWCTITVPMPMPTGTSTFKVTVATDEQAPTMTAPARKEVAAAAGATGAVVTYDLPTASDNAPDVSAVTCVPASGSTFPVGTSTVGCFAADRFGRTATTTFEVVVASAPVATTPPQDDTPVAAQPPFATLVSVASADRATRAQVRRSGIALEALCSRTCTVTTSLFAAPRAVGKRGSRPILLGRAQKTLREHDATSLRVMLSRGGAATIAAAPGAVAVSVRTAVTSPGVKVTRLFDRTVVVS